MAHPRPAVWSRALGLVIAACAAIHFAAAPAAEANPFKDLGRAIKQGAKEGGKAIKDGTRQAGREIKGALGAKSGVKAGGKRKGKGKGGGRHAGGKRHGGGKRHKKR